MKKPREIVIGGTLIPPGTRRRIELPVGRLATNTLIEMTVRVYRSRKPGPILLLLSLIHI